MIGDAGHAEVNPMLVDREYLKLLRNSYFSFITESSMSHSNWFKVTEKTWKVIGFQPFIVAGDKGILKYFGCFAKKKQKQKKLLFENYILNLEKIRYYIRRISFESIIIIIIR